jgi:hypothetical protein
METVLGTGYAEKSGGRTFNGDGTCVIAADRLLYQLCNIMFSLAIKNSPQSCFHLPEQPVFQSPDPAGSLLQSTLLASMFDASAAIASTATSDSNFHVPIEALQGKLGIHGIRRVSGACVLLAVTVIHYGVYVNVAEQHVPRQRLAKHKCQFHLGSKRQKISS